MTTEPNELERQMAGEFCREQLLECLNTKRFPAPTVQLEALAGLLRDYRLKLQSMHD